MPVVGQTILGPAGHPRPAAAPDVRRLLGLQVPIIVKLAERRLSLAEVLRLGVGSIIEFDKPSDAPLILMINNRPIGAGEAVKVGENFGLRLTTLGDTRQIIRSLGQK